VIRKEDDVGGTNVATQGSVATLVRCGGILNANFIANFLPVKEL